MLPMTMTTFVRVKISVEHDIHHLNKVRHPHVRLPSARHVLHCTQLEEGISRMTVLRR